MASETPRELPERTAWHAQYLRMIAFPVEPQVLTDQNWWRDVAGAEPDSSTRKLPKREDTGIFEDSALALEVDPFRVKWTISPHLDPENLPESVPTLGPVFARRDRFIEVMRKWLENAPTIKRLAFAGSLLQFVDTREDGYARLNQYLTHTDVDTKTSDFMYRVNRRRSSNTEIEGLEVNRLCTWACAAFKIGIRAQSMPNGEVKDLTLQEGKNACILELDINTVPVSKGTELPQDRLADIFAELVDFGLEIAERGDI